MYARLLLLLLLLLLFKVGLRPLAGWDCRFETRRVHGSLVDVLCCKVEDSASVWSLVQRSLVNISLYVIEDNCIKTLFMN